MKSKMHINVASVVHLAITRGAVKVDLLGEADQREDQVDLQKLLEEVDATLENQVVLQIGVVGE